MRQKAGDFFCVQRLNSLVEVEQRDVFRHKADAQQLN